MPCELGATHVIDTRRERRDRRASGQPPAAASITSWRAPATTSCTGSPLFC
ncbi:MAG: hypothetical protein MZU97_07705 [Bacillus subtilis]|nr:hypothetical protein [Bacillus subtilis]